MNSKITGRKIRARGIVQGVGFRPFVYTQAIANHLTGWVRNTSAGVEIEVNGLPENLQAFIQAFTKSIPPLARIDHFEVENCLPNGYSTFEIIASQSQADEFIPISPDIATCADCQQELFNSRDRRYRYPFINCTNCGPRFSIIKDIPYDRPLTTMAGFRMCPQCQAEYDNPLDRRFHAQPTACPVCGPDIWFEVNGERLGDREKALQTARTWLRDGKILAIKGLGGYHLACDATNPAAVDRLREQKRRSDKPFALMAFNLEIVKSHCFISDQEAELLLSRQRPIVLIERKPNSTIVESVAPNQHTLGFMLAYTPLHMLLLEPAAGFPDVLVMTSANLSEEPICYEDEDARQRLSSLVDGFLLHDRPIHMRVDDSVLRISGSQPTMIRRARGFAPDTVPLPRVVPPILATGAELKNTFCLSRDSYAFLSHHIGDLENFETLKSFEEGIGHYEQLFHVKPEIICCDLHPDYLATRYARQRAKQEKLPLVEVQHHHAHLAACLADNGWNSDEPVIGLSFDGTGYGPDGSIWGGEFLLGGYQGVQRLYHLAYAPQPGGDLAVRTPSRMALAHLWQAGTEWERPIPPMQALCYEERTALRGQLTHHLNTAMTSSMGRLFDAASALMGICQEATYEGQAAIEMEAAINTSEKGLYPFQIKEGILDPAPLWDELLKDWYAHTSIPTMAARFHNSIVAASLEICQRIQQDHGCKIVALSGGVWQNRYLLEHSIHALKKAGFEVLTHHQVPANDGGIALGQVMVAGRIYS